MENRKRRWSDTLADHGRRLGRSNQKHATLYMMCKFRHHMLMIAHSGVRYSHAVQVTVLPGADRQTDL